MRARTNITGSVKGLLWSQVSDRPAHMARLSAAPVMRNYEPLYFSGDASLSNQVVIWKDISALFTPLSFLNTLSKPWRGAQAHHNVSLPCLSTAAVRSSAVAQKHLKLHSCYTVGKHFFFYSLCTEKRFEGSQGLSAAQCPCGQRWKKKERCAS